MGKSHRFDKESKMSISCCSKRKACYTTVGFVGIAFFIITLLIPAVWRYSPSLQKRMIFLNHDFLPAVQNYSYPEVYGMKGTRNFYIDTDDNVSLGVWHVLPRNLLEQHGEDESNYEKLLSHGEPIVIYMHGNSGTRAGKLRLALYQKLRNINYHVIAVDYRSYADSSEVEIDEMGLVKDAIVTFKWVRERAKGTPIFGWGHSLGTGIGAHAFSLLEKESTYPNGLILEAPFNKMSDEIREHSTTQILRYLPWFEFFVVDPLVENGIIFDTEANLRNTKVPVLILHAKDDEIVPYKLSEKLYSHIKNRENTETELVLYEEKYAFGHMYIYKDKEIENRIKSFVAKCLQTKP